MATSKMMQSLQATLGGLKDEHSTLGQAVQKMEELLAALTGGVAVVAPTGKRRGRPPGSGKKAARRGRPPGSGKKAARRGRPPGSGKKAADVVKDTGKKVGRSKRTPEQKKAASERMKAFWANKKD